MHEVQASPGKIVVRWTGRPAMAIAVDLGRKATKQTGLSDNFCCKSKAVHFPCAQSQHMCFVVHRLQFLS